MGLLDHRKTWHFRVKASPQDCVAAFARAFSHGAHLMQAKWDVRLVGGGATATYRGRAGVMKGITVLSRRATSEEQAAIGSEVSFKVEDVSDDGMVNCSMWLSSRSSKIGFTADGRFFRPYMRAASGQLAQLDPSMQMQKD